ncbi:MAG TPA: RtcB family protein [Terriglobales bacterium]|nr:RtcB family protein [Terriglobales bacterium]
MKRTGIIPCNVAARSYIVRSKDNAESFQNRSDRSRPAIPRTEANRRFSIANHDRMTADIECSERADVMDEAPVA